MKHLNAFAAIPVRSMHVCTILRFEFQTHHTNSEHITQTVLAQICRHLIYFNFRLHLK